MNTPVADLTIGQLWALVFSAQAVAFALFVLGIAFLSWITRPEPRHRAPKNTPTAPAPVMPRTTLTPEQRAAVRVTHPTHGVLR